MRRFRALRKALPVLAVAIAALVFYRPLATVWLFHSRDLILSVGGGDEWLYLYMFRVEVDKFMGLDLAGVWNGGFYFPLHEQSLLFTEPQWGVSLAMLPLWLLSRDEFLTLGAGAVTALALGWVAAFAFARHFGTSRLAATAAALAFGTSGAFVALLLRPFFWPFPLVVLLLYLTDCVCLSARRIWPVAFAVVFGVLSWSSCHLTVMGGTLVLAQAGFCFVSGIATAGARKRLLIAAAAAAVLVAIPFVPQYLALKDHGFNRPLDAQVHTGSNLSGFLMARWSTIGGLLSRSGLPPRTGEFAVGLPPLALAFATIAFAVALARAGRDRAARPTKAILPIIAGALPGLIIAVGIPERIGMLAMNRSATALVYGTAGIALVLLRFRLRQVLRTPAGWFFVCAVGYALLSVGPVFKLDEGSGIPSPALLLTRLPGFSGIRASTRWSILCAFCLAISTALFLDRGRSRRLTVAGMIVFVLALGVDAWHPAQRSAYPIPPQNRTLAPRAVDLFLRDVRGPGAVFELPVSGRELEAKRMMARLFHRRLLVNGYGGMIPEFFFARWPAADAELRATGQLGAANVALLRDFGARFWIVHLNELAPEIRAKVPESFGPLKKIASLDGGQVLVYEDPVPKPAR